MRRALLILTVLLFSAYCYAQDKLVIDPAQDPDFAEKGIMADDLDTDLEESAIDDKEVHATSEEYTDMYDQGTVERELNVQDYGVGDLGETSLE